MGSSTNTGSSKTDCKLNSKTGWTAKYGDKGDDYHWMQVDLGKITTLFAVAIQGHGQRDEWVENGGLRSCASNNPDDVDAWEKVPLSNAQRNKLSCSDKDTVQVYMFSRWVKARYVRLSIYSYHNAPSLRWDLLFGDVKEELGASVNSM